LAAVCLAQCSLRCLFCRQSGGDEETRTPDPLLAKETLCQLSHGPKGTAASIAAVCRFLDPEPRWAVLDSNQRPLPYQGSALTS
jgi:hypothetical protein